MPNLLYFPIIQNVAPLIRLVHCSVTQKGQKLSFCEANESLFDAPVTAFWQPPFFVFTNIANSLMKKPSLKNSSASLVGRLCAVCRYSLERLNLKELKLLY